MHWSDIIAEKLINERKEKKYIVASGITPSGHIHVGNARETLTADAIYKGLIHKGVEAELIFIADTYDPLRKLYPFLPEEFKEYIGMPISEIPCPEGCCKSYADHFLNPYLESLNDLGIELTTYKADENYKKGLYDEKIKIALENKEKIRDILNKFRSNPLLEDWFPINVVCENCGKLKTKVLNYDKEKEKVIYRCEFCGHEGEVKPYKGRAKLPWRVDWPARWSIFNVSIEPMGKDHAAAGGSYDTGVLIAREVYNYTPPKKVVYEWIQLKVGDKAVPMSSSKGVVFAVKDWTHIAHPEILRFLLLRSKPTKHIDFDLKKIPDLVDEYDRLEDQFFKIKEKENLSDDEKEKIRMYELSTPKIPEKKPFVIPYRFCSIIGQLTYDECKKDVDMNKVFEILQRNNYVVEDIDEFSIKKLRDRLIMARNWALKYGEKLIIIDEEEAKKIYENLKDKQKEWIKYFAEKLKSVNFDALTLHELIYQTAKELGLNPREAFQASYMILLGKKYGPKLGAFLATLGKDFVIRRYSSL
ncbi:lysyl-tRNA synthetase [Methanocaldococcus vulcanius M7]|uniref:Lysine--tRNA ligase n=1 Tax=Methanocaldococcus vulcanius (strain ATCC 700851 / DSM 12094 / M7) TaxID=579137 RepID=C9RHN9_METVM|nr:lysine--tRNA ligase [Methanocaldococcus vulcanius]ACX73091.1 lysyl-tRNA synthetase [Methanocaldococcus vulcanius M7]